MLDQFEKNVFGDGLKAMVGQEVWPDRIFGVRGMRDDPKALIGVVEPPRIFRE